MLQQTAAAIVMHRITPGANAMDTPNLALHQPLPCLPASPQPAPHTLALTWQTLSSALLLASLNRWLGDQAPAAL